MFYTHIRGRGSVSDSVAGVRTRKYRVLGGYTKDPQMDSCTLDFRGCSRSFVSLLHVVSCYPRSLLTCSVLTSGGAGLFRTQLKVCELENIVFWGVTQQQDP